MKTEIPINQKFTLTLDQAAEYTGVGVNRIRMLSGDENCDFVLWVGSKRLIKRAKFEEFLNNQFSI